MSIRKPRADRKHHTPRRNHPLLSWHLLFSLALLSALLFMLIPFPAHAQEPGPTTWEWRTFTADNSPLAPGGVWALLEDSQGRIWVGTHEGVSFYQAGAWQTFTADNSLLAPGTVNVLLEDSQGRIWVGTSYYDSDAGTSKGGLSIYYEGAWQTFTAEDSPLAPGWVRHLLEDSQGRIWVGTDEGVSLYQEGAWQTFTADNSPLAPGGVGHLLEDSQGRIWIGTEDWLGFGGVSLYHEGDWQTFTAGTSPLALGGVWHLLEDSQGRIWVGTGFCFTGTGTCEGGLSIYEGTWQTFTAVNSLLAPGGVRQLLEDSQGRIWVGTSGGVSLYQAGAWQTFTSDNSPLAPGGVRELLEDSQGRIWTHLGGLEEEAAVRLIRGPVLGVFIYEDEAIRRILELADYKPYPIQRLCSFCVRRLLVENRFQVAADDVEAAWQEMQAENARRAAEGATGLTYEAPRPAWTVAEGGAEYRTGKENKL